MTITTNKLAKAYLNPVEKDPIKQNSVVRQILEVLSNYLQIGVEYGGLPQSTRLALYDADLSASGATANESTEQVAGIFAIVQPTSSPTGYEKNALFVQLFTQDPSDHAGPVIERDAGAADFRGTILAGNTDGRVGGIFAWAEAQVTADGQLVAAELMVINNGADESSPLGVRPKMNLVLDGNSGATNPVTAGIYFNGGASAPETWHHGIYAPAAAFVSGGYFINFVNKFTVDDSGNLVAVTLRGATTLTSDLPVSPTVGTRSFVSNSSSVTFGSTFTSTGIAQVPVFYGSTLTSTTNQWRVG